MFEILLGVILFEIENNWFGGIEINLAHARMYTHACTHNVYLIIYNVYLIKNVDFGWNIIGYIYAYIYIIFGEKKR